MRQFRKLIAMAVAAVLVLGVRASVVSSDMALAAANAWVAANPGFGARGTAVSAEAEYDGATLMWWVVRLDGGGAVFVAPDTSIEPVLVALPKYSGALPAAHPLRAILSADVANRRNVIAAASAAPSPRGSRGSSGSSVTTITNAAVAAAVVAAEERWTKLTTVRPRVRAVMAPTTNIVVVKGFGDTADDGKLRFWNQSYYYGDGELRSMAYLDTCFNLYTPSNEVCGCVATAGAALLQYFGCAGLVKNVRKRCKNYLENISLTTISATNHYDWTILPQEIGGEEPKTMRELQSEALIDEEGESAQKLDAVVSLLGRAVYDMGVCVNMNYNEGGKGESGAYVKDLASAFVTNFGFYSAKAVAMNSTNDYKLIYADLTNANPVALSISNAKSGHAVLAVGYGEDEEARTYTRLFMGWGGSGDAWYNLPDICPSNNMVFNSVNEAIVSIMLNPPIDGAHKTLAEAKAAALESMKPILLISGKDGGEVTNVFKCVQEKYMGDFEIYFADYDTDPYADMNPSYGVFNPLVFDRDADDRWAFYNGRLAYTNATDEAAITNTLDRGLANWKLAYEDYLFMQDASTNGIVVVVDSLAKATYDNGLLPDYVRSWCEKVYDSVDVEVVDESTTNAVCVKGWHENTYDSLFTNGQTVVFHAPASPITNMEHGVVWSCVGWNVYLKKKSSTPFAGGDGTNASFVVAANTTYVLEWQWEMSAVRLVSDADTGGNVFSDGASWHPCGDTVSVVAAPINTSENWRFSHWTGDTNDCETAGSAITVPMNMSRRVTAVFRSDASPSADYGLSIASVPADVVPEVAYGARKLEYGDNSLRGGAVAIQVPTTWEDATGGVWRCTGWTGTGSVPASGTGVVVGFDLMEDSSLTWLWEPKPEDEPLAPPDAPIGPVEGGITNSALVIYATNDTQLAVETRVSNAKAGFWYSIWSANAVTGTYAYVSGPYTGTAKQKVAEPVPDILSLTIVFDPLAAAKFYRVVVTEEDPEP